VNRRASLPYVLLALGSAAYLYPFLRVLWRVGDEGTLVYGALRVAEGAVPYRDFFEVMGPGTFYWLAILFKIFGASLWVARAEVLITGVATTLILFWLARRLRPGAGLLPAVVLLALTFPLWPATNHHWDSTLCALLSFAVFVSWLDSSRWWQLVAAGALAGLTTLFLQQKGVLLLFSLLLILLILRRKQPDFMFSAAALSASYTSVVAAAMLGLYAAGAFQQFVYANIIWPFTNYHKVNFMPYGYGLWKWFWTAWTSLLVPLFHPAGVAYALAGALLLPFLVVAALPALLGALALSGRQAAFNRTTLPYWIAGAALWISEIHRPDITHLIYGSPLLLLLSICIWQQQPGRLWRCGARALAISVLLFATYSALVTQAARTKMVTRRGPVYGFADDAALDFLDHQIRPGDAVFVYPYYPMYYFLSETTNPTRYSILMYHINTDAQFREAISALERRKVRYVLWDTLVDGPNLKQWFPSYQHPSPDKLLMEPYLAEHYEQIGSKNGFRLMQRKDDASASGRRNLPAAAPGS